MPPLYYILKSSCEQIAGRLLLERPNQELVVGTQRVSVQVVFSENVAREVIVCNGNRVGFKEFVKIIEKEVGNAHG